MTESDGLLVSLALLNWTSGWLGAGDTLVSDVELSCDEDDDGCVGTGDGDGGGCCAFFETRRSMDRTRRLRWALRTGG